MNEIMNWMQSNWYEFGSLFAQFAFLFAGLWFGRKLLKTMRASQQQFGALLRLSMTEGLEERSKIGEVAQESMSSMASSGAPSVVAAGMLSQAMDRPTVSPAVPARSTTSYAAFERPARTEEPSLSDELSARVKMSAPITPPSIEPTQESTPYVAAPLTLPEDDRRGNPLAAAGRGVVQWLQTPMASKSNAVSPWRKVVRWLQAPARS
jgi:hypothetical protein